ncbi:MULTISPECIES: SMP-30/gluconolactonase/LRE family protein [unclassified Mesorhizobium]|uniref:SMP-30/gluconolactonase/LRE family protein n=2 Tax=Mesorhizobium TaxID=68287 RepID=UPI001126A72C|nr:MULTISPECIES: SMP-30/gluconolactonase/LRE family protein [unclassified Mesorhizobium]MBZ9702810.1 SMP-30/gluconolactonase/LRE family protein [Mesorhizobium sp. CO1-1-3]MBZ9948471.1 SMP-30/gluconolactonase/LRE family protein [Mesorhizobium sp. BR1-1-11]MBZ9951690.1 SMP-30/gluconolactonase/LRE family protein [Mesorhizobium sp. BR1-1-15]MBZ9972221.1 SMP-30/gluconolactonase/LRE family protein [Mesorhizobium sp. BR1-1-12]MCA0025199.1 SMP-30/gluconolactonase/LRE family protein [Mesorhizobium sp. 
MTAGFEVAASTGDTLGESPTWLARGGELFWVDLRRPCLHRLRPETGAVTSWPMPEVIGSVVPRASGGVVVALRQGLHAFDPASGALSLLARVEDGPPEHRLNDMKCDPGGGIICGSMWDYGLHASGALYRIDAAGSSSRIRDGIAVPNAIAFAPDGRTVYFTDTRQGDIERADFDPASGFVGPWSLFADRHAAPGKPDGATVDADGFLWNARYQGGSLARFAPDGRLDRLVPLPVTQPTSCAFGGPGLKTLYVTTATQKLTEDQLANEPLAGCLLALDVGVAGLPEPAFAG